MTIQLVAPDIAVNVNNVESIHYVEGTDACRERHVIINFKEFNTELDPQYTMGEVCAALDGKCYYRPQYDEMVGTIDVCVLHGNNSKHDPTVYGQYRFCLTLDPYVTYGGDYLFQRNIHKPDVSQSWEFRKREAEEKPVVIFEDQTKDFVYEHPTPKKRRFWSSLRF